MSSSSEPSFELFTSLRYDPQLLESEYNTELSGNDKPSPLYMLRFHYERLLNALDHFGWKNDTTVNQTPLKDIESYRKVLLEKAKAYFEKNGESEGTPLKLRPTISHAGVFNVEITPTPPVPLSNLFPTFLRPPSELQPPFLNSSFLILPDTTSTHPSSHTEYKTTPRPHYDVSRQRVGIENETDPREVLIWNEENQVMEGSRTNLYFWRNEQWVTPGDESGCLRGTGRRWLAERGLIKFEAIDIGDVNDMETVMLSNGLKGFWAGTLRRPIP